jgi:hypothetical protein
VVGYYSRINNWNKSKSAEFKDRQKGDYAIHEKTLLKQTTQAQKS